MNSPTSLAIPIALQVLPLLHVILACVVTVIILRRGKELSSGLVLVAALVAWLVPLLGPVSVLIGLRRPAARQP